MELVKQENVPAPVEGFASLSGSRQIGLMVGLAASVALGVAVVLWSQTPNFSLLYGNLADKDLALVTAKLDKSAISYEINYASGAIMVPAARVHDARISLASAGLPNSSEIGFELLDKEQGFGTSRFLEKTRYHRALQGELARSISNLQGVETSRVHLAIPKQSVFVRERIKPTASVLLTMYSGHTLSDLQVSGIVHLVASSIPGMDAEQVTVVDHKGRMLSGGNKSKGMALSAFQFDHTKKLEARYTQRILDIVSPIVGMDGVRAQVVADMDFTAAEETREIYSPEQRVVRSEHLKEEQNGGVGAMGIPGALSNQPPKGGSVDPLKTGTKEAGFDGRKSSQAIRNYEVDRTISHSRNVPGVLQHISVAVLVDYKTQVLEDGKIERVPLTEEELARITALVKEAVGFDEQRQDSLNVINAPFKQAAEIEALPETPLWEQPWALDVGKQVLGGLFVLLLVFGVLRPTMHNLAYKRINNDPEQPDQAALTADGDALTDDQLSLSHDEKGVALLPKDDPMAAAKQVVQDDPKLVAQVMKTWVHSDA